MNKGDNQSLTNHGHLRVTTKINANNETLSQ